MTVADVQERKRKISSRESIHGVLFSPTTEWVLLLEDVLIAIAKGDEDPQALAAELFGD